MTAGVTCSLRDEIFSLISPDLSRPVPLALVASSGGLVVGRLRQPVRWLHLQHVGGWLLARAGAF